MESCLIAVDDRFYQLQLRLDVLNDKADCYFVGAASRDDDIGMGHERRYVVIERGLHERIVLFEDAFQLASAVRYVALETACQTNVWIGIHEYFHV